LTPLQAQNAVLLFVTLKIPNISAHNFGGNSGTPVNEMGKQVAQEILYNLKQALEEQGIEAGKKEIFIYTIFSATP
jgi:hypothetical protein